MAKAQIPQIAPTVAASEATYVRRKSPAEFRQARIKQLEKLNQEVWRQAYLKFGLEPEPRNLIERIGRAYRERRRRRQESLNPPPRTKGAKVLSHDEKLTTI